MAKINFNRRQDGEWPVFDLVPDTIVAHCGIQGGEPTIISTRIPTWTADNAYKNNDWRNYRIKKLQAFVAMCFEAGREYQRKRLAIDKVVNEAWAEYNQKHYPPK